MLNDNFLKDKGFLWFGRLKDKVRGVFNVGYLIKY